MRITLTASALILALMTLVLASLTRASPARAAEKQVWGFVESGSEALLVYGVPESDVVTLSFICDTGKKRVEVVSTVLPAKPRTGQAVKTTLRNGDATAAYDGKIGHSESGGFYVEASVAAEPKVVDVLRTGTALTISIPGREKRVPLRGVTEPLARFEAACWRR